MILENTGFGLKKSKNITLVHVVWCKTATTSEEKCHKHAAHNAAGRWWLGINAEEFIRGKFLFGLNESLSRFWEDIFHRDGQQKPDDTPFTPAFVVNQVISFEAA